MVRLKAHRDTHGKRYPLFQFHYGTIKRYGSNSELFANTQFQFHYGTIKRRAWILDSRDPCNYNSTMVRLKAIVIATEGQTNEYFNSTMVRLKVQSAG